MCVFNVYLKLSMVEKDLMWDGRLFQCLVKVTENAQTPLVLRDLVRDEEEL